MKTEKADDNRIYAILEKYKLIYALQFNLAFNNIIQLPMHFSI